MAAVGAFDGTGCVLRSHDDALDFTQLHRSKNASQSGNPAPFAASTVQSFVEQFLVMALQCLTSYPLGFHLRFVVTQVAGIPWEAAQQPLAYIWMQLRFHLGPVHIVTADHEGFKLPPLHSRLQEFGHGPKMPSHFIIHMTLNVSGVVACISVTASVPRKRTGKAAQLAELLELYLQKAR